MAGLVPAVVLFLNAQGVVMQSNSVHVERKACGFVTQAYRADVGRGTIKVTCK